MKVRVVIGRSLNRISHHALPFFARPLEGAVPQSGTAEKAASNPLFVSRPAQLVEQVARGRSAGPPFPSVLRDSG